MSETGLDYLGGSITATAIISALCVASVVIAFSLVIACDLKQQIVPNRMVIVVASAGVILRLISEPALIWINLLVAALTLFMLARLVAFDLVGGGDAKLIAATTLLTNAESVPFLLFQIVMAGGILCVSYLAARLAEPMAFPVKPHAIKNVGTTLHDIRFSLPARLRRALSEPVPYSLAIAMGAAYHAVTRAAA
jgi:prepilin peptidase CpaA